MPEKIIMLNCAAGMSTSLLVTKMQTAAKDRGLDYKIFACSASEADQYLEKESIDVVLLGPQVSYMESKFKNKVIGKGKNGNNIPLGVINMQAYGMMDGEKVLDQAIELMD